jgi:hypothetical protein
MTVLRILIVLLALLLLGAHLLRWGGAPLALLPLLLFPLAFLGAPWARRTLQSALGLAALEWLRTAFVLSSERQAQGAPYLRMLAILLCVAVFSAWAAWHSGRARN